MGKKSSKFSEIKHKSKMIATTDNKSLYYIPNRVQMLTTFGEAKIELTLLSLRVPLSRSHPEVVCGQQSWLQTNSIYNDGGF